MEIEKIRQDDGYRVEIRTDEVIVLIVKGSEERIYLPDSHGSSSSYYVEESSHLQKTEDGFVAKYSGEIDSVKVIN